jgi:hypothetical protein
MKKTVLLILFCFALKLSFSQSVTESSQTKTEELMQTGNNEIKLNIATSIVGLPELTYERLFYDNMGAGISLAISIESVENMKERYKALAFYRLYFGKKKANGFFIEGNMAVIGQEDETYNFDYNPPKYLGNKSSTNFGFGGAVGLKLLTRNGFIGELYAGGGRLFGIPEYVNSTYPSFNQGFARVGVTIGKRF